uniref:Aldo-keto reductase family 1, member B4 (Aldose reductase) n=1 Tax=Schistosoma japonicum TaxID=6182 RepID=C1LRE8_SCHJA|nr:aldo-keto reductase family 1, member B4 (aldose reductase) [Schistosoma japonicum]
MEPLKMNNGRSIPVIGLGTWNSPPGEVGAAVKKALEIGYRHLDCAYFYRNEAEIGEALENALKSLRLKREDIFITSKLWNTFFRPEHVRKACEETLKDLRLNYLDLYLVHWPVPLKYGGDLFPKDSNGQLCLDNVPHEDTWKEMEKLVDEGLVKSIGLSNFNKRQIQNILEHCRIKPANLQIEIHANFPNIKLVEYAQSVGLTVTAYAPLGAPMSSPESVDLLTEPWVLEIAHRHKKTPAQVLLRYLLQRKLIVVPKSVTFKRIEENFQVFDFQLSNEEMHELNTKGSNERQYKLLQMSGHQEYPFKEEY